MLYNDIERYNTINEVEYEKVNELVESMLENGWVGAPILVYGNDLMTGSHRFEALQRISDMVNDGEIEEAAVLEQDVAEDVTEIIEEKIAQYEEENGWIPDIDYNDIGWMLEGSWVEEYSEEITEW